MNRKWAVDSSPIILLAKVAQASLIPQLCPTFVVPLGVAEEIQVGPVNDPARKWLGTIASSHFQGISQVEPLVAAWDLGKGETQVISWSYQNREYEAILDDFAARKCAASLGLSIRGTLGVILLAKKEGHIPLARPIFEKLIRAGMRIDSRLLHTSLASVGE